ncbi:MAG: universal stress protein [Nitrososphaerota archaeon]|nr:universal stress protein [Candidatus Calditenuaceae archaeon]MDW8074088.1 universal stress protein [Nitrososphaerota archaeon]
MARVVLASIDGSPVSRTVASVARRLAERLRLQLVLLHVISEHLVAGAEGARPSPSEPGPEPILALKDRSLNEELLAVHSLVSELMESGVKVKLLSLSGDPARVILEQAEKLAAVIVLGHKGGGILDPRGGRVLKKVIEKATVPVVVVSANLNQEALSEFL